MSYLGNNNNILRTAILSLLNVNPSNVIEEIDGNEREGGGRVSLSGDFVGQSDVQVDIEIVDNAISGDPRISQPIAVGVGNGVLSNLTADATVDPQQFTLTLEDLGTDTLSARAQFEGVSIVARTPPGNGILVRVDRSGIVTAPTIYALRGELRANNNEYYGEDWNFGAVLLSGDGNIPDNAPRLRFGDDPQVYRQFRKWNGNGFVYGFSPPPVRDVSQGSRVKAVTGTYTIRVYDPNDSLVDELTNIITRYDALTSIRANSTLLNVDGGVINDHKIGGMGVTELSEQTQAYVSAMYKSGTEAVAMADIGLTVQPPAPTEALTFRCRDVSQPGREVWSVNGEVSGMHPNAVTGVPYTAGPYSATIPLPADTITTSEASMEVVYAPLPRGEGVQIPKLCVEDKALGALARDGRWQFELRLKPPPPCDCSEGSIIGGIDEECLGIEVEGQAVIENSRVIRLQRVTGWLREFILQNTYLYSGYANDIEYVRRASGILRKVLNQLIASGTLESPLWQASHAYDADEVIEPSPRNGYQYAIVGDGTSHTIQPTWGTVVDGTTTDGAGVVYRCIGKVPLTMWDEAFAQLKIDAQILFATKATVGSGARPWPYVAGQIGTGEMLLPTVDNGHYYTWVSGDWNSAVFGTSEPSWTTDGSDVTSGGFVYKDAGLYGGLKRSQAYVEGDIVYSVYHGVLQCLVGGSTSATMPGGYLDLAFNETFVDGAVTWKRVGLADGTLTGEVSAVFYTRYEAMGNDILSHARIDANFDTASTSGDGCWQDFDDDEYWWEYVGGEERYLPLQTNHWQVLSILKQDADGNDYAQSTQFWGFGFKFGCPDNLIPGDRLIIDVKGTGASTSRYQEGDTITASITHAKPVKTDGGQTGNDTQLWKLRGSAGDAWPDYAFLKTAPAAYAENGLGFLLTLGGIRQALGDHFLFEVEGGRMRYRFNGGAWSSTTAIEGTVALDDGLEAVFQPGAAPSWVAGDVWSFMVEAVNGPDKLRQPTNRRASWHTSTELVIDPGMALVADGIFIGEHTIPSSATITLQGSDDDFSTTPLNQNIPWKARNIYAAIEGGYLKYKLIINQPGSIRWVWLGVPTRMLMIDGIEDRGTLTKSWSLPGNGRPQALIPEVDHTFVAEDSVEALLALLNHAVEFDARMFGFVPHPSGQDASIVAWSGPSLEVKEVFDYQPENPDDRYHEFTLKMDAVP